MRLRDDLACALDYVHAIYPVGVPSTKWFAAPFGANGGGAQVGGVIGSGLSSTPPLWPWPVPWVPCVLGSACRVTPGDEASCLLAALAAVVVWGAEGLQFALPEQASIAPMRDHMVCDRPGCDAVLGCAHAAERFGV